VKRRRTWLGSAPGGEVEVVLQLLLAVAVEDQVDARVDLPILDLAVQRHVGAPLRGVVADQVVGASRLFVQPHQRRRRVAAD
jgi:hypothetical protein